MLFYHKLLLLKYFKKCQMKMNFYIKNIQTLNKVKFKIIFYKS